MSRDDEGAVAQARGRIRRQYRYRMDNLLSRGTWAVLLWLGAVTALAVLLSSVLLAAFSVRFTGGGSESWLEDAWQSLLRMLDTGTMAGDVGWGPRLLALVITVFGILVAGTLIGLIASGVEQRVDEMQRGRSTVVEQDHLVVVGDPARLAPVIEQLALAGRVRGGDVIVALAAADPAALRDEVRTRTSGLHGSRLVIRSGQPDRASDLAMASVVTARAVIVVAGEDASDDGAVVQSVLAVGTALGGFGGVPIVAELGEVALGRRLVEACGPSVHPLMAGQAIARLTTYALREPELHQVVDELLDYRGSDLYLHELGRLAPLPFGEIGRHFATSRPIGLLHADGRVTLAPDPERPPAADDRLVLIAPDGTATEARATPVDARTPPAAALACPPPRHEVPTEHVVVVGWNALGRGLLASLEEGCAPGSTVEVVHDPALLDLDELGLPTTGRLNVTATACGRLSWDPEAALASGEVTALVFLGYRHGLSPAEADSRTLLDLLLLRRALEGRTGPRPRVVVEVRDPDSVELARLSGADTSIVGDDLTSRLLTQLAELPERRAVLLTLYAAEGPSLGLVAAADLGVVGEVAFADVAAAAAATGMVAIGWCRSADDDRVVLNPPAATRAHLAATDRVIVIA